MPTPILPITDANTRHAAQVAWDASLVLEGAGAVEEADALKDAVRYTKGEPLQEVSNYADFPDKNEPLPWRWPVSDGSQHISVVGGEVQGSYAHIARGVGPAVDLPGFEGQDLLPVTSAIGAMHWYGHQGGYMADYWFRDEVTGCIWYIRYCHMAGPGSWTVGHTGDATGPHLHMVIWKLPLDAPVHFGDQKDEYRVRPENVPQFVAMLEA